MNLTDFLTQLRTLIDTAEKDEAAPVVTQEFEKTPPESTEVMVPPLQQKIELLKKIAGVDSVYGEDAKEKSEADKFSDIFGIEISEEPEETEDEELSTIKKNAGLSVSLADDLLD